MKLEADPHRADEAVVTPLRKRRLTGELYARDPKIEALIAELAGLPRDALIRQGRDHEARRPRLYPQRMSRLFPPREPP